MRDHLIPLGQQLRPARAARRQVAAHFAGHRDARQRVRHRGTADQQDALVAIADRRDVLLGHDRARAVVGQRLDHRAEVHAVRADPEDAGPAHAVQRLEDDIALLGVEFAQALGVARDDGRCGELAELRDRQLLGVVADRLRLVEHARALPLGDLQQPGAGDVFHVERRVLAHQHGVEAGQRQQARVAGAVPVVLVAGQGKGRGDRLDHIARQRQLRLLAGIDGIAARRRLAHHREGGILVNLEC